MTSVRAVYDYLDQIAPFSTQLDFDNSGLMVGAWDTIVTRAMVSLDASPSVVAQAAAFGAQLLVSHHPVLFRKRAQLLQDDPAWMLARHNIAAIATHTPLDLCKGGVNDALAQRLEWDIIETHPFFYLCKLPNPLPVAALARQIGKALNTTVRYCNMEKIVTRVALCGGAGCHFMEEAYAVADAFLTGDADHHAFLDAQQHGVALLAAGHFETEIPIIPRLTARLQEAFPAIEWRAAKEDNIVCYETNT